MSAAAFAASLANDAEYRSRVAERQAVAGAQGAACAQDEAGLVAELRSAGEQVASVYDYVAGGGAVGAAVPVLAAHLARSHHPRVWEGIVRALATSAARDQALGPLRDAYRVETAPERRWLLANALSAMARFAEVADRDGIAEHRPLFELVPAKPPHVAPAILRIVEAVGYAGRGQRGPRQHHPLRSSRTHGPQLNSGVRRLTTAHIEQVVSLALEQNAVGRSKVGSARRRG